MKLWLGVLAGATLVVVAAGLALLVRSARQPAIEPAVVQPARARPPAPPAPPHQPGEGRAVTVPATTPATLPAGLQVDG
ncbi:MAG: hypothetical protein ACE5K7_03705 [Phycisphaerae bacterium]